eukprot:gene22904-biopygen2790
MNGRGPGTGRAAGSVVSPRLAPCAQSLWSLATAGPPLRTIPGAWAAVRDPGAGPAGSSRLWPALAGSSWLHPAPAGSGRLWPAPAGFSRL